MYKNVIFDVDGTIINSYEDVTGGICYALEKCGYPVPSNQIRRKFIGPSVFETFTVTLGLSADEAYKLIDIYREKYKEINHKGTVLYAGYPELLERLKRAGVRMSLASTKPQRFLRAIFEKFGIDHYFERFEGAPENSETSDKVEIIERARLDKSAVMVGDRKFDIVAACSVGIDSIGVTYGFMEPGEFDVYRPTYIANNTDEIFNIVMNG